MGQVEPRPEKKVQRGAASFLPERVEAPHRQAAIAELQPFERGDFFRRETGLPGRGKEEILVGPVDFREREEEVPEIRPHARLFAQERAKVKPEPHWQVMYVQPGQKSNRRIRKGVSFPGKFFPTNPGKIGPGS